MVEALYENPNDLGCSSSAMVVFPPKPDESVVSSGKAQAQVTAEDVSSPGHVLRFVFANQYHLKYFTGLFTCQDENQSFVSLW